MLKFRTFGLGSGGGGVFLHCFVFGLGGWGVLLVFPRKWDQSVTILYAFFAAKGPDDFSNSWFVFHNTALVKSKICFCSYNHINCSNLRSFGSFFFFFFFFLDSCLVYSLAFSLFVWVFFLFFFFFLAYSPTFSDTSYCLIGYWRDQPPR